LVKKRLADRHFDDRVYHLVNSVLDEKSFLYVLHVDKMSIGQMVFDQKTFSHSKAKNLRQCNKRFSVADAPTIS